MKIMQFIAVAALAPALVSAADFSGTWKLDNNFNGKVSGIHCTLVKVILAPDGSISGKLLRNGSDSPIKGVRQP